MAEIKRLLFVLVLCMSVIADAKVRFGPEFNFTNDEIIAAQKGRGGEIVHNEKNFAAVIALRKYYKSVCGKICFVEEYLSRYGIPSVRVRFRDGWYFEVETDPAVVEVKTKPMTLKDMESLEERMNQYIFQPIYSMGLQRANSFSGFENWAGGHIHVDLAAFGDDVKLFRNFIVDYTNHVELAHHIFANDTNYAPSIQLLSSDQRAAFKKLVADVDLGKVKTILEFATRLQSEVYYLNPFGHEAEKHQALNVTRIVAPDLPSSSRTLEIRAFRAQAGPEILRLEAQLLESRIDFLRQYGSPIEIRWANPAQMGAAEVVNEFYRYVRDSDLDFEPYKPWLTGYDIRHLSNAIAVYRPILQARRCARFFN